MSIDNHDRLDKELHAEEYLSMPCGSLGYIRGRPDGNNGETANLKVDAAGNPLTEKKYCDPNCPTLIAEHKAG